MSEPVGEGMDVSLCNGSNVLIGRVSQFLVVSGNKTGCGVMVERTTLWGW